MTRILFFLTRKTLDCIAVLQVQFKTWVLLDMKQRTHIRRSTTTRLHGAASQRPVSISPSLRNEPPVSRKCMLLKYIVTKEA